MHSQGVCSSARRGTAVVVTAVTMAVLVGFAALAIDVGYLYSVRAELQKAADASALAGATQIRDKLAVATVAQEYADQNYRGQGVILDDPDVLLGNWDSTTARFSAGGNPINALGVILRRSEVNNNPVRLFLANILGVPTANVEANAVALIGGARCAGIWGLEGITGSGDIATDSYRSEDGFYGGDNIYANGDLCSNQDIELQGDVDIWGDAMYGPGNSVITSGNAYYISGDRRQLCCQVEPPQFDINDIIKNNDNDTIGLTDKGRDPFEGSPWDLVVTGKDNLTLAGGTYYFASALVDGIATLTIAGPTAIYISGPAEFTGNGLVNVSQVPGDLVIYSIGAALTLRGTAGFYGAIIAPETDIMLTGTGEYYGTIIGKTMDVDGAADIHVDESLIAALFDIDSVIPILVQ